MEQQRGFTIVEIIIIIAVAAIFGGLIVVSLNPARQFIKLRNADRLAHITTLAYAIDRYAADNKGALPSSIALVGGEICRTDSSNCSGLVDLAALTNNAKYLASLPMDPLCPSTTVCNDNGIGYTIVKMADNRVRISAPAAEGGEVIQLTR